MYVYRITNKINNKKYIGITNNYKRRFKEHILKKTSSAIHKAIIKYGEENFIFEIIYTGLSVEESCEKEIELIQKENTLVPYGYNIAKGGITPPTGENNGRAILTQKDVQYIKDHRNIPMYVLYEEFNEKISYSAFKDICNDKKWNEIRPHVEPYPYNLEFSNQFTSHNKLDYDQVVELRKEYANQIPWRKAYEKYKDSYSEMDFWNIYNGNRYKLVMPEVFTPENKHFQASLSHSGEDNGRAKLKKEDVIKIRELHNNGHTNSDIYKMYPQVSSTSIRNIINYKTWKNL